MREPVITAASMRGFRAVDSRLIILWPPLLTSVRYFTDSDAVKHRQGEGSKETFNFDEVINPAAVCSPKLSFLALPSRRVLENFSAEAKVKLEFISQDAALFKT